MKKKEADIRIEKVPVILRNKFKGTCAVVNMSMREVLIQLMEKFVNEHTPRTPPAITERGLQDQAS